MSSTESRDMDYILKIVILGKSGVGKTSLLKRFTDDEFSTNHLVTIGVDFKTKDVEVLHGKIAKLQLWDTAGQDLYRTLVASYYRGSDGLIVVYDITDRDSFEQVPYWLGEAGRYASPDVSRMLIGNKADKEQDRAVDRRVAQSFADRYGLTFIETSAKSASNVESAFINLAHTVIQDKVDRGVVDEYHSFRTRDFESFKLGESKSAEDNGCYGTSICGY